YGDVKRATRIVVRGLDRKGRETVFEMEGLAARVVQHEIDHLDGILFIDKADPATLHWSMPAHEEAALR
ncbi:MAG: peptide deformylase, partial [Fimbriimonadaceae bacterium]|nr:peptide deformylase [Fimbriimonadaceae bacterium]